MSKVQVAVRVRPFNKREEKLKCKLVMAMQNSSTILFGNDKLPELRQNRAEKTFTFDHSIWSVNPDDENFVGQEEVYAKLGVNVLKSALEGFNACIFAYGQTGSGKSYTMMGGGDEATKGLIPRLCHNLFATITENEDDNLTFRVEVSYLEIYNERVRDLLGDVKGQKSLRVREHQILGPYVEGLTKLAVRDHSTILRLMEEGNQSRTVAATSMNSESSRSHAVFSITVTQEHYDPVSEHTGQKVSKISLVDLAGSERANKTGATDARLKEGSNINKSLTTLGIVISALADASSKRSKENAFIPYRDSTLTWLLKDNLGGNSKTVMVATVSPASDNYDETLSTLRYADRAKRIVNNAVVNEDPSAKIIRQLREEVETLRAQLGGGAGNLTDKELLSRLKENESLMAEMELSWEQKLKMAEETMEQRQRELEEMGISINQAGVAIDRDKFYLVNLNEDPAMSDMLVYYLKKDKTTVGSADGQDIVLQGIGLRPQHAILTIHDGMLLVTPLDNAPVIVNGIEVTTETRLKHAARLLFGSKQLFRVACPRTAADTEEQDPDWEFAQQELVVGKSGADYLREKEMALDEQRQFYEQRLRQLGMASATSGFGASTDESGTDLLPHEVAQLQERLVHCAQLIREANMLSDEMCVPVGFQAVIRLSEAALANPALCGLTSRELAVLMTHKRQKLRRYKSLEAFEKYLDSMKQAAEARLNGEQVPPPPLFFQNSTDLIGVACLHLDTLRHGTQAEIHATIVNQEGRTAGQLRILIITEDCLEGKAMPRSSVAALSSPSTPLHGREAREAHHAQNTVDVGDRLRLVVRLIDAQGLPTSLANAVHCRFQFPPSDSTQDDDEEDDDDAQSERGGGSRAGDVSLVGSDPELPLAPGSQHFVVYQHDDTDHTGGQARVRFPVEHEVLISQVVTPDLHRRLQTLPLAFAIYGHSSKVDDQDEPFVTPIDNATGRGNGAGGNGSSNLVWDADLIAHTSYAERWAKHLTRLQVDLQVLETNDRREFEPVFGFAKPPVASGYAMRLREDASRRLQISVGTINGARLPMTGLKSVSIGSLQRVPRTDEALHLCSASVSDDVELVQSHFLNLAKQERERLEELFMNLADRDQRTEEDEEQYRKLRYQMQIIVKEREAVQNPKAGSGLPGAESVETFPDGIESKEMLLYVPLASSEVVDTFSASKMSSSSSFVDLRLVEQNLDAASGQLSGTFSWDAAAHTEANLLLQPTQKNEVIMFTVRIVVGIEDSDDDVVITKLMCCKVVERGQGFEPGFFQKLRTDFIPHARCGLRVIVVTGIPMVGLTDDDLDESDAVHDRFARSRQAFLAIDQADHSAQHVALSTGACGANRRVSYISQRPTALSPIAVAVGGATNMPRLEEEVHVFQMRRRHAQEQGDDVLAEELSNRAMELQRLLATADEMSWVTVQRPGGASNSASPSSRRDTLQSPPTVAGTADARLRRATAPTKSHSSPLLMHKTLGNNTPPAERAASPISAAVTPISKPREAVAREERSDARVEQPKPRRVLPAVPPSVGASPIATPRASTDMVNSSASAPVPLIGQALKQPALVPTVTGSSPSSEPERQLPATPQTKSQNQPSASGDGSASLTVPRTASFATTESAGATPSSLREFELNEFLVEEQEMKRTTSSPRPEAGSSKPIADTLGDSAVKAEPVKAEPVKAKPVKAEPVKAGATKAATKTDQKSSPAKTTTQAPPPAPANDNAEDEEDEEDEEVGTASDTSTSRASSAAASRGSSTRSTSSGRRTSKWAKVTTLPPAPADVGERVLVVHAKGRRMGTVRFYGFVDFSPGPWVGVEYDKAEGKHDGSKGGKTYFSCPANHGSFVRPDAVRRVLKSKS